jgi:interleukin-1 receptor-associated kinase 1
VYNGEEVAVKKLYQLHGLDDKVFDNEFRNLRNIHHENVVRLLGYCYELRYKFVKYNGNLVRAQEMERALCFEYMQGGSLDKHISGILLAGVCSKLAKT